MRIYLTHCCKGKADHLRETSEAVTPDQLYIEPGIQAFIERCKERKVDWAILSDLYGIYLPSDRHQWYEKHPDTVTAQEKARIISNFNDKLSAYAEIFFYVRPDTFHPLYEDILQKTSLAGRIQILQELYFIE